MHFELSQRFAAPVDAVADAYTDPGYYAALADLPKLGEPELLDRTVDGDHIQVRVRYRFVGDLSAAVRAVVDPAKLTWVEVSNHRHPPDHSVRFELQPDNYADRLSCHGTYRFHADPDDPAATVREVAGELKVRAPLVASSVERAIISGLREHFDAEAPLLQKWLSRP